jgi:membrane associated rhomboid family serine protease
MVSHVDALMQVAPNANLVGMPTPNLKTACVELSIGTWPTAILPKKIRTESVNFPPPQVPPPPPQQRVRFSAQRRNLNPYTASHAIIAANLGLFVWGYIFDALHPGTLNGISQYQFDMGLAREFLDTGEWYRLVSSGFLHFGLFHVGMNMFLLYQLSRMLEPTLGSVKFALVYFASLFGGAAGALIASPNALTGGASGAVFGMMAAAIVGMRQRGVNPLQTGLGLTFVINIGLTLAIPNISVGGHFGGALAGAACGVFVLAPAQWRLPRWTEYVGPLVIGIVAAVIAVTPSL